MDIGVKGVLECKAPLNEEETIFVRFGYWWLVVLVLISGATYFYRKKKLIKIQAINIYVFIKSKHLC